MRWLRLVIGLSMFTGFLTGCSDTPAGDLSVSTESTQSAGTPDVIVVPDGGSFGPDLLVECGGSPLFLAGALVDPPLLAEVTSAEGAMEPIEEFLLTGEGDYWPQSGYRVLTNDAAELLLVHVDRQGSVTLIGSEMVNSEWTTTVISSGQSCPIRVPLPNGLGEVAWRIDPDRPTDPNNAEVHLLATGLDCSSGQPMGDRLMPPQTIETDEVVYVALVANRPQGDQNCPGNPEEAVTVTLQGPLGDRTVVDARRAAGTMTDYVAPG